MLVNQQYIETVTQLGKTLASYSYDAVGNLTNTTLADGTVEKHQYDQQNRLTYLETRNSAGNLLSSYSYTLDGVGNKTQVLENTGRTVNYTYDSVNQLTQEAINNPNTGTRTIDYTYDPVGNRKQRNDSGEGLTTYNYDANNRLTSSTEASKVTNFTYDNNGSMLSRSDGTGTTNYTWIDDGENRLVGVKVTNSNGTSTSQYIYDADGNRVASIVDGVRTNYLVDPMRGVSEVLLEYDTQGHVTTQYTYGLDLIRKESGGTDVYYHYDASGSTRILTDSTGQVTDRYDYDAYGRTLAHTGTTSNAYQYSGEQRDSSTGLDYLRARYYDSDLGRFISRDAFGGFMDDPMSQNHYQYANANPVNFTDPSGYFGLEDISAAFAITGILAASGAVGAGAGYLLGAYANGASGEDLLNLTDQWVAGFANFVSFGASTTIRSNLYGEVAEQNHSGFMWNMGQLAGAGAAMIFGAATPENLTFNMGRSQWIATIYDGVGTGVSAWETGTHIREGRLEWSDAFNLLPFVPFAAKGIKQFLGTAIDVNGSLRNWGRIEASAEFFGSCFVAGTKVLTPTGEQTIENIAVGDTVISADPESGEIANHQVKHLFKTSVPIVLDINVGEVTITCSPEHPFWVPGEGWQEAGKLQPGTLLLSKDGLSVYIDSIKRREGCFTVYNIEVEGLHTYYVSALRILVHNKSQQISPTGHPILVEVEYTTPGNAIIEASKPSMQGKLTQIHRYENPGHHSPNVGESGRGNLRYNSTKSVLPDNHIELFKKSIPFNDPEGKIYRYAQDSSGNIHRFEPSLNNNYYHWSGSTDGRTLSGESRSLTLPIEVKKAFK